MKPIETANMPEGELIDGQFRIHHQIGEGGMGTVWAAEDLQLGRMVAAKFLWQHMAGDPRVRQRFQREARMTARVRSAHVVQVFAQGCTADDVPYLIMELLDGEDLSRHLERCGRCGLRETCHIVEQVCRGLSHAHAEGLVHRDIKPHNIFLGRAEADDGRPHIKLLDFGIAKDLASLRDSLTARGEVVGSALYSSPEQLRDPQAVDRTTDIWALGILIYELLTGRVPFPASSLAELIELHSLGRIPNVGSFVPDLPGELDAFFERALHMDARKRWASVEELSAEFAAIARSVPDVPASEAGSAFGVAQTLRSSPSMLSARAHAKSLIRSAARWTRWRRWTRWTRWTRWNYGLVLLALALLGVVMVRAWSARPEPLPVRNARVARVGAVTPAVGSPVAAASETPTAPATGSSLPDLREPRQAALVLQPTAAAPARAAPRPPKSSSRSTPRPRAPARPAARDEPTPSPTQTELPGRNHGF